MRIVLLVKHANRNLALVCWKKSNAGQPTRRIPATALESSLTTPEWPIQRACCLHKKSRSFYKRFIDTSNSNRHSTLDEVNGSYESPASAARSHPFTSGRKSCFISFVPLAARLFVCLANTPGNSEAKQRERERPQCQPTLVGRQFDSYSATVHNPCEPLALEESSSGIIERSLLPIFSASPTRQGGKVAGERG